MLYLHVFGILIKNLFASLVIKSFIVYWELLIQLLYIWLNLLSIFLNSLFFSSIIWYSFGSTFSKTLHFSNLFLSSFLNLIIGVILNPFLSSDFFNKVIAALTEFDVLVLKMPCFLPQKIFPGTLSKSTINPFPYLHIFCLNE